MNKIQLVFAMDDENGIGKDNALPWDHPLDLQRFKEITKDTVLLMGRHTFESLPNVLPVRHHVVLTTASRDYEHARVTTARSLDYAMSYCANEHPDKTISVIGGQFLFDHFLKFKKPTDVYVTRVTGRYDTDVRLSARYLKNLRNKRFYDLAEISKPNNELTFLHYTKV